MRTKSAHPSTYKRVETMRGDFPRIRFQKYMENAIRRNFFLVQTISL